jgi:serine/threonine protein kinase
LITLALLFQKEKTLPIERCLNWIIQVVDALIYLHSRQPSVFHRDIKPSNIRVTPDDRAMLVDFGLVKLYDPALKTTMGRGRSPRAMHFLSSMVWGAPMRAPIFTPLEPRYTSCSPPTIHLKVSIAPPESS